MKGVPTAKLAPYSRTTYEQYAIHSWVNLFYQFVTQLKHLQVWFQFATTIYMSQIFEKSSYRQVELHLLTNLTGLSYCLLHWCLSPKF